MCGITFIRVLVPVFVFRFKHFFKLFLIVVDVVCLDGETAW